MGAGSTIWAVDEDSEPRKLWNDKVTVVGSLSYSPDGKYIAFNNLLDSPVPFAKAGLWVIETDSEQASFLTVMDGGHGQQPLWSRDGAELYFVRRDNLDDTTADYKAEALVSSVRAFRLEEREERELASSDGARQIDLSLTLAGELVFASNRGGGAELWVVSPDGSLRQVTIDGSAKRHPLIVSPGYGCPGRSASRLRPPIMVNTRWTMMTTATSRLPAMPALAPPIAHFGGM